MLATLAALHLTTLQYIYQELNLITILQID